jgi:predicted secreted protein with PEFG-CTERM motif
VTLNGIGLPGTDPSTWTGPKGDMLTFHVIPEFGPIVLMIVSISILGVILIQKRFRF